MKKNNKIFFALISVFIFILAGLFIYKIINGNGAFIELDYKQIKEKIDNKDDFVLVISQTTCPHCASYKPKIKAVALEKKITIYYTEFNLLDDKEKVELADMLNFSTTPLTVFFKDGKPSNTANRISGDAVKEKIISELKNNGFIN